MEERLTHEGFMAGMEAILEAQTAAVLIVMHAKDYRPFRTEMKLFDYIPPVGSFDEKYIGMVDRVMSKHYAV
jgi:hypothetical protein